MRTAVSLILLVTLASVLSNLFVATPITYACGSCNFILAWGSQGSGPSQFSGLDGVAVDSSGNVYVADTFNGRVEKFTSTGTFLTQWGSFRFYDLGGISVDSPGNVYVTENNRVEKFTSNGTYITQWGSYGSGPGQFNQPRGIAVDSAGNVYVADGGNNRVQKLGDIAPT